MLKITLSLTIEVLKGFRRTFGLKEPLSIHSYLFSASHRRGCRLENAS